MAGDDEQLGLATAVTIAWLSNPHTRAGADDVSTMLGSVLTAFRGLDVPVAAAAEPTPAPEYAAAVTVRRSLASPEHIISMLDGKPYRSLTRHLKTHGLTPDQYRQRFGLRADYPMVAPSYSAERSAAAKQHNFGRPASQRPPVSSTTPPVPATPAPVRVVRVHRCAWPLRGSGGVVDPFDRERMGPRRSWGGDTRWCSDPPVARGSKAPPWAWQLRVAIADGSPVTNPDLIHPLIESPVKMR